MSDRKFISYSQDQDFLLPPSLRDWLPEGHLAHFVSDSVDSFDLSEWEASYASKTGAGAPPFPPQMMLKVMLYGYAVGVFSSRKLATRCVEDVAFRYLAGQLRPDFRSILKFRKRHLKRFQSLFVQVVELARESGMVKLGRVAIDGSKFKANASKHKAMSYSHMCAQEKKLQEEIAAILEQVEAVDAAEDEEFGDYDGYSLPDALAHRQKRLATIQAAKARLEERARERARQESERREEEAAERESKGEKPRKYRKDPDPMPKAKEQENFTDPDSRIMKDGASKGFIQAYNAQIAVDDTAQIVVATTLNNQASDSRQLLPVIEAVYKNTGTHPEAVLADAGYKSEENFETLATLPTDGYIACGREAYDPREQCPRGPLPRNATHVDRMERKLKTKKGRKTYKKRKHIVEPVFGWIKQVLGFRQLSLRGEENAQAEFEFICAALNLRRMATIT
jgi:transposase|tara:strand:- start:21 stop:1376 length:1356 start_codon:yes stop_codon:yes gene_type:complete